MPKHSIPVDTYPLYWAGQSAVDSRYTNPNRLILLALRSNTPPIAARQQGGPRRGLGNQSVQRWIAAPTSFTRSSRRNGLERKPAAPWLIAFSRSDRVPCAVTNTIGTRLSAPAS